MLNKFKLTLFILAFVVSIALILLSFCDFILIVGTWRAEGSDGVSTEANYSYTFGLLGDVSTNNDSRDNSSDSSNISYRLDGNKLIFIYSDGETYERGEYIVSENRLAISGEGGYNTLFNRSGMSVSWWFRIIGLAFAAFGTWVWFLKDPGIAVIEFKDVKSQPDNDTDSDM